MITYFDNEIPPLATGDDALNLLYLIEGELGTTDPQLVDFDLTEKYFERAISIISGKREFRRDYRYLYPKIMMRLSDAAYALGNLDDAFKYKSRKVIYEEHRLMDIEDEIKEYGVNRGAERARAILMSDLGNDLLTIDKWLDEERDKKSFIYLLCEPLFKDSMTILEKVRMDRDDSLIERIKKSIGYIGDLKRIKGEESDIELIREDLYSIIGDLNVVERRINYYSNYIKNYKKGQLVKNS